MNKEAFFKNFGGICVYAFFGTFISAMFIGGMLSAFGAADGVFKLSSSECFAFGALISATDPVSVLAIMKDMNANENLYALIFGESIFNDAITIVLYKTIVRLKGEDPGAVAFFESLGLFLLIFIGSFVIGVVVAFATSYVLKRINVSNPENRQ
jgi:NhaP-type Na+/H+ or K+/H+ antiporter